MADFIIVNKDFYYQSGIVIFPMRVGETRTLEFIKTVLDSHIIDAYFKDGTFTLLTQQDPDPEQTTQDPVEQQAQDDTPDPVVTQAQELVYKTAEALVTSEGANIKKGAKMTEQEILNAGLDFQQLIADGKLMEVKMTK